MAIYAIGDIQGCYVSFKRLLEKIAFNPAVDRLWLVGDMINRGKYSLEVMRWIVEHEHVVNVVLGNHDLHALCVYEGFGKVHRSDTLETLFSADDGPELIHWLRQQPLMVVENDIAMVHAGLLPQWSIEQALSLAGEVETKLRSEGYREFLRNMYGNQPNRWDADLTGMDRLRLITNTFTRLRIMDACGAMEFSFKGEMDQIPDGYVPWFEAANRQSVGHLIVFGHWSALGLHLTADVMGIDTGCLWGRELTALRLEDRQTFSVPSAAEDLAS